MSFRIRVIPKKLLSKVDSEGNHPTDHNNVAIGNKINFKVTSKVSDMTGYSMV